MEKPLVAVFTITLAATAALAAMSDWTNVEQAGYNLASEISGSSSFFELADSRTNFEV